MSKYCHWFKGTPGEFDQTNQFDRNPGWVDYQVLGPTFGAVSMMLGTKDILPIFVNSRGCAYHIRFTHYAWGPDFGLAEKPLPFLEFSAQEVIHGNYRLSPGQLSSLQKIVSKKGIKLLVLIIGDNVLLSGDGLDELLDDLTNNLHIPARVLRLGGLSGSNPYL